MKAAAGRPARILWSLLEQMRYLIDVDGIEPHVAARRTAANPLVRRWLGVSADALTLRLKRQWHQHKEAVVRRAEEALRAPLCIEADLWRACCERQNWYMINADTMEAIVARRNVINDPLLDLIAEVAERARDKIA
jgi:hypothetical protein